MLDLSTARDWGLYHAKVFLYFLISIFGILILVIKGSAPPIYNRYVGMVVSSHMSGGSPSMPGGSYLI